MSAYNVTLATLNRVANLLEPDNEEEGTALLKKLQRMNAAAVSWRYDENPEPWIPCRFHDQNYTTLEMVKAAHCYLYQCSEGDVPKTELFKRIERIVREAEQSIKRQLCDDVNNLKEYQDLPWDFPMVEPVCVQ